MVSIEPLPDLDAVYDYPVHSTSFRFEGAFWTGDGSSYLGLRSPVRRKELIMLLKGQRPNGKSAIVSDWDNSERILGWRMTMQAPQTVESLWALAPSGPSNAILKAHCLGMDACMKELGDWANHVALTKGLKSKGLIAAYFHPDLSEQKATGLKSDVILVNATPTSKRSAVSFEMLGESCDVASKALSRVYEQELLGEVRQRMGLLSIQTSGERQLFGVPPSLQVEKSWTESRQSQLLEAFRRGERAPYKDQWMRQADSLGWGLPEVKKLLEMGRRHSFNSCAARRNLRTKMREIENTEEHGREGKSSRPSQSNSSSQSHSH